MTAAPASRTRFALPGLPAHSFSRYLAGLGLVRVLAEQADADLAAWWDGSTLMIDTTVPDLAEWLVTGYRPTPVISPWNGGSGFGLKDKSSRVVLQRLQGVETDRLADLQQAVGLAEQIVGQASERGWDKARQVSELRNVGPEALLRWLDACIVLRDGGAAFPPLLGTGGNDGRLDFSTNFHQRLIEVLPELGAKPAQSRGWATDLLHGTSSLPLIRAAIGQFDPGGAGGRNSSPFGAAESQVNPWEFVLLIEGALYFASGIARRQGAAQSRAAMPFCVWGSSDGPVPGADGEDSRGEIWAPVWNSPLRAREISQVFAESRASWQGEIATQTAQMYAALRSFGVARGIDRFIRYGLHKRNGLAFSAVRLDEVAVRESADIQLSVAPQRIVQAYDRVTARTVSTCRRRAARHHLAFVSELKPESLRDLLAEITLMDLATMRSSRARDDLNWRPAGPPARDYATFLHHGLRDQAAFRVAAALASGRTTHQGRPTSVRDLVVGVLPRSSRDGWADAKVTGLGIRPLADVLADLLRWRAQQEGSDVVERGFVPFPSSGVRVPWPDLHAWVAGSIDDREVSRSFLACLALDWGGRTLTLEPVVSVGVLPNLELALFQAFASGRLDSGSGAQVESGAIRYGLNRDWPTRLLADTTRPGQHSTVVDEAAALVRRLSWKVGTPARSDAARNRIVAALVARSTTQPLRRIGASPPRIDPTPLAPADPDDDLQNEQGEQ